MGEGPLKGIRVLEFTWVWAGPYAGALLADLGAEVIKVESRNRLDGARGAARPGQTPYFVHVNRGKKSCTIDIGKAAGVGLIKSLVPHVDVVLDNFSPSVM